MKTEYFVNFCAYKVVPVNVVAIYRQAQFQLAKVLIEINYIIEISSIKLLR